MPKPPSAEEIVEVARLAVATYFDGSDKTKRVLRFDMETLRGMIRSYDSHADTQRLTKDEK